MFLQTTDMLTFLYVAALCLCSGRVQEEKKHLVRFRKRSCCGLKYLVWSPPTQISSGVFQKYQYGTQRMKYTNVNMSVVCRNVNCRHVIPPTGPCFLFHLFLSFQLQFGQILATNLLEKIMFLTVFNSLSGSSGRKTSLMCSEFEFVQSFYSSFFKTNSIPISLSCHSCLVRLNERCARGNIKPPKHQHV